jgi:hypothetical protein
MPLRGCTAPVYFPAPVRLDRLHYSPALSRLRMRGDGLQSVAMRPGLSLM